MKTRWTDNRITTPMRETAARDEAVPLMLRQRSAVTQMVTLLNGLGKTLFKMAPAVPENDSILVPFREKLCLTKHAAREQL